MKAFASVAAMMAFYAGTYTVVSAEETTKPLAYAVGGALDLRPSKVWNDDAGHLHLRFDLSNVEPMPSALILSKAGEYELVPYKVDPEKNYSEIVFSVPVSTVVLKLNGRQAIVALN
ncbi:hypothetical protein [Paraburkholderia youngii]|uniref:hypothetical protein n=1 Tax=Paraburkholderia youngii TaxID=2782701 RepID=UPI003D1E4C8D